MTDQPARGQPYDHIDREKRELAARLGDLAHAMEHVLAGAGTALPEDRKTTALADVVSERELCANGWCTACKRSLGADPPVCPDHDRGGDIADELRRYRHARMGAHPG